MLSSIFSDASLPYVFSGLPLAGTLMIELIFRTQRDIDGWYSTLIKPSYRPPNWVFGPVWTFLYLSMGYASYLVYRDGTGEARDTALVLYAIQYALNWWWSPIFFKFHKLGLSTVVIIAMGISIAACILKFYPINQLAALLMLPYLAWISFASVITYSIWQQNKHRKFD